MIKYLLELTDLIEYEQFIKYNIVGLILKKRNKFNQG